MQQDFDPIQHKVMVGLEIHQQLATKEKLFCSCPVTKSETLPYSFERRLRPAQSEVGRLDPAAVFEFAKGKVNVYRWNPESSCLVEADEEPPHAVAREPVDTCVLVAQMLRSNVIDELHVMRKIVIDGSNTGGFQRTTVIGLGGYLEADGDKVGVQTVTLEEDASRILGEDGAARYFALDRLGVPLVEIALEPVAGDPEKVERVALQLGRALRSTGRVARGLGTIRQDLNVSVMGGKVVEVKGVQKLNMISKVVAYEVSRQLGLIKIAEELGRRNFRAVLTSSKEASALLSKTASRAIQKQLKEGGMVVCVSVEGFAGLLGWEPIPGVRLGRELAEVARANSLGGIIHSDEFAMQGLTVEEDSSLRKAVGASTADALILVAGPTSAVERTVPLLVSRLESSLAGVPAETRAATEDGETRFMRPRPGAQRMYPETDIPDVVLSDARRREVGKLVPEPWEARVGGLEKDYALSHGMALKVYDSDVTDLFKELSGRLKLEPSFIASTLVELPVRLSREGVSESAVAPTVLAELLRAISDGRATKESAPDLLRAIGRGEAMEVDEAISSLGLHPMGRDELAEIVDKVVRSRSTLIAEKGEGAFSALMGEVMQTAKGRADGQMASILLGERLARNGAGGPT